MYRTPYDRYRLADTLESETSHSERDRLFSEIYLSFFRYLHMIFFLLNDLMERGVEIYKL